MTERMLDEYNVERANKSYPEVGPSSPLARDIVLGLLYARHREIVCIVRVRFLGMHEYCRRAPLNSGSGRVREPRANLAPCHSNAFFGIRFSEGKMISLGRILILAFA